jgi:hypothetical protein
MGHYIRNMLIILIGSFLFKIAIADPMRGEQAKKAPATNFAAIR